MMARQTACSVYTADQAFFNRSKQISPVLKKQTSEDMVSNSSYGGQEKVNYHLLRTYLEMDVGVEYFGGKRDGGRLQRVSSRHSDDKLVVNVGVGRIRGSTIRSSPIEQS
mgnify:CR=1 FL=1